MKITIKDVAKETGFSVATISMVINGKNPRIPESTKKIILDKIKEMGYRPNRLAIALATKKTRTIGLIVPDNSNSFFASLSKFVEVSAKKENYTVVYGNSDNKIKRDIEYFHLFMEYGVDGVIFARSQAEIKNDNDELLNIIKQSNIPVVFVDRIVDDFNAKSVMLDNRRGGYLAAKHLIDLGHKQIACAAGPLTINSSKERLAGFKEAMEESNLQFDESLVFVGDYDVSSGVLAMDYLKDKKFTGVFAFADVIACGVYKEAKKLGISIPDQLSVVGFDNLFFSDILTPSLTTINQPIEEMSVQAVETLIAMIEKDSETLSKEKFLFQPTLIVRESSRKI